MKEKYIESWRYLKWRLSPTYHKTVRMLKKTDYYPLEYWKKWQFNELKKVLIHSYDKVPYYRDVFNSKKLNPYDMKYIEEFNDYPFLDKDTLQNNIDRFIADGEDVNKLMRAYTSGTTGEPTPLIRYWHDLNREKAFHSYTYFILGINPYCKKVLIRGSADDENGKYFYKTDFGNTLRLSSLNLSDENLISYVKQIRLFKPKLIYATPSVLVILCQFMERNNIDYFESVKMIYPQSESLYDEQRNYIEKILKCRINTSYGQSEHVVSATQCQYSSYYHVLPQYSFTELMGDNGEQVTEDNETGEIVGTSFTNMCCPLIRYRTKDYAIHINKKCGCKRNFTLWQKIIGRPPAIAFSKKNIPVSLGPEIQCTILDEMFGQIKQFNIIQNSIGILEINILPFEESLMSNINLYFEKTFKSKYPGYFDLKILKKEQLELTKAGKSQFFTQNINVHGESGCVYK